MRILLAVDESENSRRVARYVGALLCRTPDVALTLFHVLKPMPRELLEHGGSEDPATEAQLGVQLRDEQEAWIRKEGEAECHILKQACETLHQSGFDTSRVTLTYGHEDDIARNILGIGEPGQSPFQIAPPSLTGRRVSEMPGMRVQGWKWFVGCKRREIEEGADGARSTTSILPSCERICGNV